MKDFRVLVTGSRDWPDAIWLRIDLSRLLWHAYRMRQRLVLVHGDCPTGADFITREWVEELAGLRDHGDLAQERYPADWGRFKLGAGPRRNQYMVSLGADLCLAYPRGESRGTRGCARMAGDAGIPILMTEYGPTVAQTLEHRLRTAGIMILEEK